MRLCVVVALVAMAGAVLGTGEMPASKVDTNSKMGGAANPTTTTKSSSGSNSKAGTDAPSSKDSKDSSPNKGTDAPNSKDSKDTKGDDNDSNNRKSNLASLVSGLVSNFNNKTQRSARVSSKVSVFASLEPTQNKVTSFRSFIVMRPRRQHYSCSWIDLGVQELSVDMLSFHAEHDKVGEEKQRRQTHIH
jgi:hypothetical protein